MSDAELARLCAELENLVNSGVPLGQGLASLSTEDGALGRAAAQAGAAVTAGTELHAALGRTGAFPPEFLALVRAGETSGRLVEALVQYQASLEARRRFKKRLIAALAYPCFVAGFAFLILAGACLKLAPMLLGLMQPGQAPGVLTAMAAAGGLIRGAGVPALVFAAALAVFFSSIWKDPRGRRALAGTLLSVPVLGPLYRDAGLTLLYVNATMLLGSGLQAALSLELLETILGSHPQLADAAGLAARSVREGKGYTEALRLAGALPPKDAAHLAQAELAGRLPNGFAWLGKQTGDSVEHRAGLWAKALEIGAILLAGALTGAVVLSVYGSLWAAASGSLR